MTEEAPADGVLASTVELVDVEEVERLLAAGDTDALSPGELAFAQAHSDPARRLAARLAARDATRLLVGLTHERRDAAALVLLLGDA
jgi:hypothetical protein